MQSRGGYGGSQSGNLSNFHSVFGGSAGDTGTPPLLDLSEFPSLTNARSSGGAGGSGGGSGPNDSQTNSLQPPGSKPYGNIFSCMLIPPSPTVLCQSDTVPY